MLKHRSEVALEIVLENKNVNEVGIARGAQHVPRQSNDAECRNRSRMREAKCASPLVRRDSPNPDRAARKYNPRRTFRQNREPKPRTE